MKIITRTVSAIALAMSLAMPLVASANVQEMESKGKPNVLIDYFWRSTDIPFAAAEQLRGYVMESLVNTKRAEIMDVDTKSTLRIEAERREAGVEAGDDAERMKVMAQEGANFLVDGRITSLVTEKKKNDDGGIYYTSQVGYTLKVINPNDGKTILTRSFTHGGELFGDNVGNTPEEAVTKAVKKARDGVSGFFQEAFPLFGLLLEAGEVKDGKVNTAYMSLGEAHGVAKKDKFDVCVVREIAGRKSVKTIAEAEVTAVEGDDISAVKIKKNQKELKAAIDGGQTIVFKSVPKKAGGLGGFKL